MVLAELTQGAYTNFWQIINFLLFFALVSFVVKEALERTALRESKKEISIIIGLMAALGISGLEFAKGGIISVPGISVSSSASGAYYGIWTLLGNLAPYLFLVLFIVLSVWLYRFLRDSVFQPQHWWQRWLLFILTALVLFSFLGNMFEPIAGFAVVGLSQIVRLIRPVFDLAGLFFGLWLLWVIFTSLPDRIRARPTGEERAAQGAADNAGRQAENASSRESTNSKKEEESLKKIRNILRDLSGEINQKFLTDLRRALAELYKLSGTEAIKSAKAAFGELGAKLDVAERNSIMETFLRNVEDTSVKGIVREIFFGSKELLKAIGKEIGVNKERDDEVKDIENQLSELEKVINGNKENKELIIKVAKEILDHANKSRSEALKKGLLKETPESRYHLEVMQKTREKVRSYEEYLNKITTEGKERFVDTLNKSKARIKKGIEDYVGNLESLRNHLMHTDPEDRGSIESAIKSLDKAINDERDIQKNVRYCEEVLKTFETWNKKYKEVFSALKDGEEAIRRSFTNVIEEIMANRITAEDLKRENDIPEVKDWWKDEKERNTFIKRLETIKKMIERVHNGKASGMPAEVMGHKNAIKVNRIKYNQKVYDWSMHLLKRIEDQKKPRNAKLAALIDEVKKGLSDLRSKVYYYQNLKMIRKGEERARYMDKMDRAHGEAIAEGKVRLKEEIDKAHERAIDEQKKKDLEAEGWDVSRYPPRLKKKYNI